MTPQVSAKTTSKIAVRRRDEEIVKKVTGGTELRSKRAFGGDGAKGTAIPSKSCANSAGSTTVVPLCDVAFSTRGHKHDEPGDDAWSRLTLGSRPNLVRERPGYWRGYRRSRWIELPKGSLSVPIWRRG
jgi:hypothetical protein